MDRNAVNELRKSLRRVSAFLFIFDNIITTGYDRFTIKKIREINDILKLHGVQIQRVDTDKYGHVLFKLTQMEVK